MVKQTVKSKSTKVTKKANAVAIKKSTKKSFKVKSNKKSVTVEPIMEVIPLSAILGPILQGLSKSVESKPESKPQVQPKKKTNTITPDTITDTMMSVESAVSDISIDSLEAMKQVLMTKSSDYGPVYTIVDLMGKITGYDHANIPLSEVSSLTRVVTKIIRYMTLRASGTVANYESLLDSTKDLIGEVTRLSTAVSMNIEETK